MKKLIIILLFSFLFMSEAYSDNYNKLKNTPTSLLEHRNHLLEHKLRKFFNYESINVDDYKDGVFISFMERDACKIIRSTSTLGFYSGHSPNELKSIGYGGSKYHCDTMSEPKENQVLGCFNIEQLSELCGATINYFITATNFAGNIGSHPNAGWHIFNTVEAILGDINGDNSINVQDIVLVVNLVLSGEYSILADLNSDSAIDVLDIVQLVNVILS